MAETKKGEISRFDSLANNPSALLKYQTDSGLTRDVCQRILLEVEKDRAECLRETDEKNAIDGEESLKTLYRRESGVDTIWTGEDGHKPVDLVVVRPTDEWCILGDCKFGLKSADAWLLRKQEQFEKEFLGKVSAVRAVVKINDGVNASSEMLFIVTSSMVALLKNRIEDYKLDSRCTGIPYDHIHVCSVRDLSHVCEMIKN